MSTITNEPTSSDGPPAEWLELVRRNAANLRFGSIQITVHDGRVTQVESIEKTRFVASQDDSPADRK